MKNNDDLDFVKDGYTSEQELFAWELMCGDKFENFIKTPKENCAIKKPFAKNGWKKSQSKRLSEFWKMRNWSICLWINYTLYKAKKIRDCLV